MISVIIPTRHRNDLLALCLDHLAPGAQALPADQYEVIVTDDGSQSTAEALVCDHYPWAQWTAGPRRGPAANRNHGASLARGEWLAFTDDDCLPSPEWLAAYRDAICGPNLALEGAIHPLGDTDQDLAECPVNLTGGYFWSANIAVQRALFEQIGGFDPTYPLAAHEDVDIKIRLQLHTTIVFVPQASVVHPVRKSSLIQNVLAIPKHCSAWCHHVNKHQSALGYHNKFMFATSQYKSHAHDLISNWQHRKYQSFCLSAVMLLVGVPLNLWQTSFIHEESLSE